MVQSSLRNTATEIVRRLQSAGSLLSGSAAAFVMCFSAASRRITMWYLGASDDVEKLFERTIAVGKKFGVMVVVEGDHQFQVATFRAEGDYQDGRRPSQVIFGDARADALRRDSPSTVCSTTQCRNNCTIGSAARQTCGRK